MSFTAPNDFHRIGHGEKRHSSPSRSCTTFFGTSIAQDLLSKNYKARWIPFSQDKEDCGNDDQRMGSIGRWEETPRGQLAETGPRGNL